MKNLLNKLIEDKKQTKFRIVWDLGLEKNPILAVCNTRKQCSQVIKDRKQVWFNCLGHDVTSQLKIVSFKCVNELEDK